MIRIIDGKRYNTDTAEEVASVSHGYVCDFRHYSEVLYRTKRGAWFLFGEGGPLTRWGEGNMQDGRSGGSGIVVMSADDARDWLEHHDEVGAIEKHFADDIQDA